VSFVLFCPFLSLGWGSHVHMHVAFSFLYHIMFASLYYRLHLYHMIERCASPIYIDHCDMLDVSL
jgi:hypothetical protein